MCSLVGLIVSLDQLTKWLTRARLPLDGIEQWSSWITLAHIRNNGFGFGLIEKLPGSLQNLFFVAVPVFALLLIIMIFIKSQDNDMLTSLALTSILGGAVGNMIDRIEFGSVLDLLRIQVGQWQSPPFNIADMAILIGVGLVFVSTLRLRKRGEGIV